METAETQTAAERLVGHVIGGYRLVRVLEEGATSATLLGQHVDAPEQQAAIKIALAPWGTPAERGGLRAQFNREAQALFALQHPHLLGIYALGVDVVTGNPYMVLPYPDGGTLAGRLSAGALALPTVADYLAQLGDALDTAHALGMVHGDLTPASILLDDAEQLYLGGFGKAPEHAAYMAPELSRGQSPSLSTDHYSLGVVLYEMVTGYVPFQGATPAIVLMQHAQLPPPPPRALRPELPEQAEAALLRALAKQPSERFASAIALSEAFARGLKGESLPEPETTLPQEAETAAAPMVEGIHPQAAIAPPERVEQEAATSAPTPVPPAEELSTAVISSAAPQIAGEPQVSAAPEPTATPPSAPTPPSASSPSPVVTPQADGAPQSAILPTVEPPVTRHPAEDAPPPIPIAAVDAVPATMPSPAASSAAPTRAVTTSPTIVPVTTNPPRTPTGTLAPAGQPDATPMPVMPALEPAQPASSVAPAPVPAPTAARAPSPARFARADRPIAENPITKYPVSPALIRNIMLTIFALVLGVAAIAVLQFLGAGELALMVVVVALFMYCGIILPGLTARPAR